MTLIAHQWPETLPPADIEFGRSRMQRAQRSPHTRSQQTVRRGLPLWTASATWRVSLWDEKRLRYILDGLEGRIGSVLLRDFKARPVVSLGTVTLSAPASQYATSVATAGWTPSTVVLAAGQWLQIGRRLYLAASAVTSDGAGAATIMLDRPLRTAAASGAAVNYRTPACEMRMMSDDWSGSRGVDSALKTFSAEFIETTEDY